MNQISRTSIIFNMRREDIFDFKFKIFLFEGSQGPFKMFVFPIEEPDNVQIVTLNLLPLFQYI